MKLSPVEYDLNMHQLSKVLKNVPPHIRDLLIYHLNKMDLHVQALEDKLREVKQNVRTTTRSDCETPCMAQE